MLIAETVRFEDGSLAVLARDTATEQTLATYAGRVRFLAAEAERYLTRFLAQQPDATLADVRVTFHCADEAR